jgi:hypothetical protein
VAPERSGVSPPLRCRATSWFTHGATAQLPTYLKGEEAAFGIYLCSGTGTQTSIQIGWQLCRRPAPSTGAGKDRHRAARRGRATQAVGVKGVTAAKSSTPSTGPNELQVEWRTSRSSYRLARAVRASRGSSVDLRATQCGYLRLLAGPMSGQTRSRCSARRSHLRLPTGVIGVALTWPAVSPGAARGEAQKGFVLLEVAVPSLLLLIG